MDKIIELFMKEPEKQFHIREIAKILNISPMTVAKYLKAFEKKKLLTSEKKYNHLFFKANSQNQNFKDLKREFNIRKIRKSGLIEYLIEEYNHPEAIVLFGSFAKAENIPRSDIDILIVSPIEKEINLDKFEKKLSHNIQLFLASKTKIKNMKNKDLLNNWINGIVLEGYWELFS